MPITSLDSLINSFNSTQSLLINKATIATQIAGGWSSLWRAVGIPAQGAIPTIGEICTKSTLGAMSFSNPGSNINSYIARGSYLNSNASTDLYVCDRMLHIGGLSGTVVTAQAVNLDASDVNLNSRRGDSDYSDVQWWIEWYTATGATGVNFTVAVTYVDNSTANIVVAVPASTAASRLIPIYPPSAGKFIKSIQSVTLSATTGTAGNFGITANRVLCNFASGLANSSVVYDWQMLGLPLIANDACLTLTMLCGTTSTGNVYGTMRLVQQ